MNIFKDLNIPIVYKLPIPSDSIIDKSVNPQYSINIDYPSFVLGFQHYIHANKDKLNILDEFKGKKKVYEVINRLNKNIDEYDNDLESKIEEMTGEKIEQEFLIYWELLSSFPIIENNDKIYIRKMSNSVNNCFKYFSKNLKIKLNINDGPADVICISYEGGNYDYRNTIEQDTQEYIFSEISDALKFLNKNGSLIIKLNEIYTKTTNKAIYSLTELFKEVYLYKPITSEQISSDKFLICLNLNKNKDKTIKFFKEISNIPKNMYIVDFYKDFILPENYISVIRKFNTDFSNRQLIDVNRIVEFIKSENYYGEDYQDYRDIQINSTSKWIDEYLTDINKNKKNIENNIQNLVQKYLLRSDNLNKKLKNK